MVGYEGNLALNTIANSLHIYLAIYIGPNSFAIHAKANSIGVIFQHQSLVYIINELVIPFQSLGYIALVYGFGRYWQTAKSLLACNMWGGWR